MHSLAVNSDVPQDVDRHGPFTCAGSKSDCTIPGRCGMVTSLTGNGHVSFSSVPIACQPSQTPHSTASTTMKTASRFMTFLMAGQYRSCRVRPCPWTLRAPSPSSESCAS
jgi:hypothetical protein